MPIIISRNILQFLVVVAYFVLITLSPSVHFIHYIEFHDCQRVIQLILLGLVLLDSVFIGLHKTSIMPVHNKIRLSILTLVALSITSAVLSIEPRYAAIEVSIFVALCYLAIFVARMFGEDKEKFIQQLTYILWASIVLYMVSFYTGYITAMISKTNLVWPYPFYGFSNIRLFQQYQLWCLGLICLPLLVFDLKKKIRLWLYFALTCWWVLLFYAASRGVIVSWIVAILMTAIVYKKLAWPFLRIQMINAITGLVSYLILFKAIPATTIITSTIFRDTVSDRTGLWKVAIGIIKDFPLFGIGPMHFYFYNTLGTHPHNSVLQFASEWGVLATLIILVVVGYSLYCWMRKFNVNQLETSTKSNRNLTIILFFTIIANGAYSLVEGVIVMPISQVLMFTIIGLMIGQYTEKTWVLIDDNLVKRRFTFRPILASMVFVLLLFSTMPELIRGLTSYNRTLYPNEKAFSMAPNTINPRIWMQQSREK